MNVFFSRGFMGTINYLLDSCNVLIVVDIFILLHCRFMSLTASQNQAALLFTTIFFIMWVGSLVVTVNASLLGGNMYMLC
jgi:hypothetical protein